MPVSEPSSVNRLRERSFTVSHITGEKRPVVFLHVAEAEVEGLRKQRDDYRGRWERESDAHADRIGEAEEYLRERDGARAEVARLREVVRNARDYAQEQGYQDLWALLYVPPNAS